MPGKLSHDPALRRVLLWLLGAGVAVTAGLTAVLATYAGTHPSLGHLLLLFAVAGVAALLAAVASRFEVRRGRERALGQARQPALEAVPSAEPLAPERAPRAQGQAQPPAPMAGPLAAEATEHQPAPRHRKVIPDELPGRSQRFRGRAEDLSRLTEEFNRQWGTEPPWWSRRHRQAPATVQPAGDQHGPPRTGPVLILLHGMPGVGKTALVQEFAHQIAARFTDGHLYVNLGIGRRRRAPADVLQDFLKALGIADSDVPADVVERTNVFRSLTADRRILIVLDAARGYDQVRHLLPTGTRCAVLITSRRDFGAELVGGYAHPVEPPSTSDAREIFAVYAGTAAGEAAVEVSEIVDYAGALPLALRSAGQQVADRRLNVSSLANRLENRTTRLRAFKYQTYDIQERIEGEYERLPDAERQAFRLLSLVDSPTFGPWVLAPLMGVGEGEAESLAARLASYHLLLDAGQAADTGLPRYAFHPLVWLVARKLSYDEEGRTGRDDARRQLSGAYLGAAATILTKLGPAPEPVTGWGTPAAWKPFEHIWVEQILSRLDHWIRTEYCNLLRTVTLADSDAAWGLAWRIAARLGPCVAGGLPPRVSNDAFEAALHSADQDGNLAGRVEVLLSHAAFLNAVEQYPEAFRCIQQVLDIVETAPPALARSDRMYYQACAHRRMAEAWLQLGTYAVADRELKIAQGAVLDVDSTTPRTTGERERIELLIAENNTWYHPSNWLDDRPYRAAYEKKLDDAMLFRVRLGLSDQSRRRQEWKQAHKYMLAAFEDNYRDARRAANVQYRTARLLLNESSAAAGPERLRIAHEAVASAGDAARILHFMGNTDGVLRAKALLVRALMKVDRKAEAGQLASRLKTELAARPADDPATMALEARIGRSRAEVLMDSGQNDEAAALFQKASEHYERQGDWRSKCDTLVSLATLQHRAGHDDLARSHINWVLAKYQAAGDDRAYRKVRHDFRWVTGQ
ncbi:MAG TPA: NB-ARC domain-containing protein [Streptosporangiaceae bacterium]